jgi:hypothetical protein
MLRSLQAETVLSDRERGKILREWLLPFSSEYFVLLYLTQELKD